MSVSPARFFGDYEIVKMRLMTTTTWRHRAHFRRPACSASTKRQIHRLHICWFGGNLIPSVLSASGRCWSAKPAELAIRALMCRYCKSANRKYSWEVVGSQRRNRRISCKDTSGRGRLLEPPLRKETSKPPIGKIEIKGDIFRTFLGPMGDVRVDNKTISPYWPHFADTNDSAA